MQTRYLKLTLPDHIAANLDRFAHLAADYDTLSPQECYEYDTLCAEVLAAEHITVLPPDTSVVGWYPLAGCVPPVQGKHYLLSGNRRGHVHPTFYDGQPYDNGSGANFWLEFAQEMGYTHYAELPVKE